MQQRHQERVADSSRCSAMIAFGNARTDCYPGSMMRDTGPDTRPPNLNPDVRNLAAKDR